MAIKSMVDVSIVIVNYNVCYFLEQCLNSIDASIGHISKEVFVVDNNSVDDSMQMVAEKFPGVIRIENKENLGFSKANNQAIKQASGRYILLLNPDTVIEEDTLIKCIEFMDSKPKAGGLGVRMLDGKGNFLPESKRGLPSPKVAFCKIFGLSKFFKKSRTFNYYHLGHLSEFETHEIDILSGAFMFMRAEALEKVGLLDEAFFMYGEDIDLSYRLQKGGYENYYFPETKIIHYKGESTKKSSVNYVFVFYRAMIIFAKKHFSEHNASLFSFAINSAIYLRAGAAVMNRIIKKTTLPLVDFLLTLSGLYLLTNQWKIRDIHFTEWAFNIQIPLYATIWVLTAHLLGAYDRGTNRHLVWKSSFIGTLFILVVYALLPKDLQFSRLFILIGMFWNILQFYLVRLIINLFLSHRIGLPKTTQKRFAILGSKTEFERIEKLLSATYSNIESSMWLEINSQNTGLHKIEEVIQVYRINELIFSAKDLTSKDIISLMSAINTQDVDFKIAQPETDYLIGSNSIDSAGDLYIQQVNLLIRPENRRSKRLFDLTASLTLLILSPFLCFFQQSKIDFFRNLWAVLKGDKTWVGAAIERKNTFIKPGIILPIHLSSDAESIDYQKINLMYAKIYSPLFDMQCVLKNWRLLGK
jgi:GT2 family glycosyltransferase